MSVTVAPPAAGWQGMPNLGVPLVNQDNTVSYGWYRFFVSVYNVTLAGLPTLPTGVVTSNPNSLTLANVHSNAIEMNANFAASQAQQDANFTASQSQQNVSIASLLDNVVALQNQITALQGQIDAMTVGGISGSATAGTGGVLPAQVTAYLVLHIGSTSYKVPLYLP